MQTLTETILGSDLNNDVAAPPNHNIKAGASSPYFTAYEAAIYLGIDERAVHKLIKDKILCAKRDKSSAEWQIDTICVQSYKAQALSPQDHIKRESAFSDKEKLQIDGHAVLLPSDTNKLGLDDHYLAKESINVLLKNLSLASDRLQGASYRIGYLESKVESLEEQLKTLPELRARAAQEIITERENTELKEQITQLIAQIESQTNSYNSSKRRLLWWHALFSKNRQ
jgi:hypothetical protein